MRIVILATLDMSAPIPLNLAPLNRRLAALAYDGLLLIAIILVATALTLPFSRGDDAQLNHPGRTVYLLSVCFVFFGWFWTHGGQTLGMRAWRIRITDVQGAVVTWQTAALRFLLSLPLWIYTIGILLIRYTPLTSKFKSLAIVQVVPMPILLVIAAVWLVIDHWPNNWRDRLSGTRVSMLAPGSTSAK